MGVAACAMGVEVMEGRGWAHALGAFVLHGFDYRHHGPMPDRAALQQLACGLR